MLKNFWEWTKLNEADADTGSVEIIDMTSDNPSPSAKITYKTPSCTISKVLDKKGIHNQFRITNSAGKTYTYELMGYVLSKLKEVPMNFKYLKKEEDGGFTIGRYVDKGVEDYTVSLSQIREVLTKLTAGQNANPAPGLNFYKV